MTTRCFLALALALSAALTTAQAISSSTIGAPAVEDEAPPTEVASIEGDLDAIEADLRRVDELTRDVDALREWHRDGMTTRIDLRSLDIIRQLNDIASEQLESNTPDDEQRNRLVVLLDIAASFASRREHLLEDRQARELETLEKFAEGPQANIARVFIDDVQEMRRDYAEAYFEQARIRRTAGLPTHESFDSASDRVERELERAAGQIRLDAMTLARLRDSLVSEPLDADLIKAIELVDEKQQRNLADLDRIVGISEMLDLDASDERSLLISERGALEVDILDERVFAQLLSEQWQGLRDRLLRDGPNFVFRALLLIGILALTWFLARLVRGFTRKIIAHEGFGVSRLARAAFVSVSFIATWLVGLVVGLGAIGVALGPMVAGLGVAGILVGFAIQDSLGNLASGVMILIFRPFDVDDHVKVAGAEGLVKKMNFLATTIATFDNKMQIVPNGRIWGDTIENLSANKVRRVDVEVSFSYDEDPERIQAILLEVVKSHEAVLETPAPAVHFTNMNDSALVMKVKPWVHTVDYWTTYWALNHAIFKRFAEEGIEIPFPQRVIHIKPHGAMDDAVSALFTEEASEPPSSVREDDEPDLGNDGSAPAN